MTSESKYIPEIQEHYGRLQNYVDGDWVDSESTEAQDVIDPAKDKAIAEVPISTRS